MKRTVLACGVVSFVMAFAGAIAALTLAIPALVSAQAGVGGTPVSATVISDPNGTQRIRMGTGPGYTAAVRVFAPDGTTPRVSMHTATGPAGTGANLEGAALTVSALDGTGIARLGTATAVTGGAGQTVLLLRDRAGRERVMLRVAEDGTPSIQLLDAAGNVTWSAR